jgi:hypothetical protein
MKGCNVVKYGRYGEPKVRKFFLSSDEKYIFPKLGVYAGDQ